MIILIQLYKDILKIIYLKESNGILDLSDYYFSRTNIEITLAFTFVYVKVMLK